MKRSLELGKRIIRSMMLLAVALWLPGCFARAEPQPSASEQRQVDFSAKDSMALVKGVLRNEGVLFTVDSPNSLTTLWSLADTPPTFLQSLIGSQPRYRYHMKVLPRGAQRSELVVSLITENVPAEDIGGYEASRHLDLFRKFDRLAAAYPPTSFKPSSGGVIFSVLPGEDLKALARRATGSEGNWRLIAADNGLSSPSQVKPFQTVWVRDSLLRPAGSVNSAPGK